MTGRNQMLSVEATVIFGGTTVPDRCVQVGELTMMLEPEVLEELEKTLDEIKARSANGVAIVVEGKKDECALRELGIEGPVHQVPSGGKTPLNSLEELSSYEKVIILTDFDRTGEDLAVFCRRHLERLDTRVLFWLRNKLRKYVRKAVKDIEGMSRFIRTERGERSRDSIGSYRSFQSSR